MNRINIRKYNEEDDEKGSSILKYSSTSCLNPLDTKL